MLHYLKNFKLTFLPFLFFFTKGPKTLNRTVYYILKLGQTPYREFCCKIVCLHLIWGLFSDKLPFYLQPVFQRRIFFTRKKMCGWVAGFFCKNVKTLMKFQTKIFKNRYSVHEFHAFPELFWFHTIRLLWVMKQQNKLWELQIQIWKLVAPCGE